MDSQTERDEAQARRGSEPWARDPVEVAAAKKLTAQQLNIAARMNVKPSEFLQTIEDEAALKS